MRTGIGYDIHRFSKNRPLMLGGVRIPHHQGLLGHSDADVVLHAICDALLGAAGLGDIGMHFPDTDKRFKNIASIKLVRSTAALLKRRKLSVAHIDVMLVLEAPKIAAYKEAMRCAIAAALGIRTAAVNIKATTHEGIGPVGNHKACMCWAAATLTGRKAARR